jgi:integrase
MENELRETGINSNVFHHAIVRVEMVKMIELYEPTTIASNISSNIESEQNIGGKNKYGISKFGDSHLRYFNHFTFLVNPDGTQWADANRYLLSKVQSLVPAKARTLESIASDLRNFRQWLIDENVDYLLMPSNARAKPTYRYCKFLHDQIDRKLIKTSTAKRRMISTQNFYRWLIVQGVQFENDPWLETDNRIFFKDNKGFQQAKVFKSTDLTKSFKYQRNSDEYGDTINDGGKLRPLSKDEQIALVKSLKAIGNIEMLLSFLFSICTGARLQTVFTLRTCHFEKKLTDDKAHSIKVGRGTLADTKNDKQMILEVPACLYKRIQIYLSSARYKHRLHKSNLYEHQKQYVFLTKEGKPYYMSRSDENSGSVIEPPRGNAVTQFIRQQLKPHLLEADQTFDFRFHYLRASFGMNLVDSLLSGIEIWQLESNQPKLFEVLMYVRQRMGHSQLSTTEAYLNYRKKYHLARNVQHKYEEYLQNLILNED